jgi:GT2 family glycosyltransferase
VISDDDTADEPVATAPDRSDLVVGPAAPPVTVLVVTHAPGAWFDETLAAFAALEYPAFDLVVADAASPEPVGERVRAVLPQATVIRLDENLGFGRSVNATLSRIDAASLLLLAHDDVAPEPDALRHLVEEAFRSNASIVGPKTLRWSEPDHLLSVGEGADKFGYPVPIVERGELDQEQHDAVRDVFTVPDGFTLVRRDLLDAVGGFDEEGSWFGDDLDLCWRAHVAGGRVMAAPSARVRHVEALGERRPIDDRRRHQFRHRMRTMLGCYGTWSLVRVVPQLIIVHAVEIVFALLTGRPAQARDVATAWTWNLRRWSALRQRRAVLAKVRMVRDAEVRSLQVRGSARIAAFLRGQLSVGDDPLGSAATMSRRLVDAVAGPGRRTALLAWMVVGVVVLIGSRHLLTRPIPSVGSMVPFPEQITPLFQEWWASWRRAGLGSEGFAASADLVGAVGLAAFLGAGGLFRTVVLVGMLPLGLYGAWRLVAPTHSIRASVLGLIAYGAVPVGYDSFATGSWRGLLAYGVTPWVVARLVRASGTAPFGEDDPPAGPRVPVPPLWRQCLVLGVVVALAATIDPLWVVLPLAIVLAMVPGAIAGGSLRGLGRMSLAATAGCIVGAALHGPWAAQLVSSGVDWSAFAGTGEATAPASVLEVLSFDTGPIGRSVLNAGLVVSAAYVLLVGRGWRLGWAARGWSVALVCWGVVLAEGQGWLPFEAPEIEVLLAPAGVMMALCIGLGAAAFDFDVRRRVFSWRQIVGVVALVSLGLAFLPVMAAAVGGRWGMPRSDHAEALSFLDEEAAESSFRVLWIGAPEVLPLGSWPLGDVVGDGARVSYATTLDGSPTFQDGWPGPPEAGDAPLRSALEVALDLDTTRLGRVLAPAGVRYVVVVDRAAPAPYGGVSAPVPDEVVDALEQQLDLARIELNPDITLYRNAAWAPRVVAVASGTVPAETDEDGTAWMRQAIETDLATSGEPLESTGPASARGPVDPDSEVLVGSSPGDGWDVTVDGGPATSTQAFDWTVGADTSEGGAVVVSWTTPLLHRLVLVAQVVLVVAVAAVLYATRAEARDRRRMLQRSRRAEREAVAPTVSRRVRRSEQRSSRRRRSR